MKWKTRPIGYELKWHPWFAWYPVRLDGRDEWVWLERIIRRRIGGNKAWGYEINDVRG